MSNRDAFSQNVVDRQADMFRIAERDFGLSLKVLATDARIPFDTLKSWAKGGTTMPITGFAKLAKILPDHLLSLVLDGTGKHVGTDTPDDGSLDALAREAASYNVEYLDAHNPNGEAGSDLSPRERVRLKERSARIAAVARCAAAA